MVASECSTAASAICLPPPQGTKREPHHQRPYRWSSNFLRQLRDPYDGTSDTPATSLVLEQEPCLARSGPVISGQTTDDWRVKFPLPPAAFRRPSRVCRYGSSRPILTRCDAQSYPRPPAVLFLARIFAIHGAPRQTGGFWPRTRRVDRFLTASSSCRTTSTLRRRAWTPGRTARKRTFTRALKSRCLSS